MIPIAEAAREFGLSVSTIWRHVAAGRLTTYTRPGGRIRTFIDRRDMRTLLEPKPEKRKGRK